MLLINLNDPLYTYSLLNGSCTHVTVYTVFSKWCVLCHFSANPIRRLSSMVYQHEMSKKLTQLILLLFPSGAFSLSSPVRWSFVWHPGILGIVTWRIVDRVRQLEQASSERSANMKKPLPTPQELLLKVMLVWWAEDNGETMYVRMCNRE